MELQSNLGPYLCISFLLSILIISHAAINDDAQSLLNLKSAIDPSNSLPWRLDDAVSLCSSWVGVKQCSSDGRITKLVLESLNLTGTLTSDLLSSLDQLRVLSLKSNSLTGEIPELSSLSNLKLLYLSENRFSGKIPLSLASLHRIRIVALSDNSLSGPIPIVLTSIKRLISLQLQNNVLTGQIPPFKQSTLLSFNVSNNRLFGEIPFTTTLSQFNISSFSHNPNLCGKQINKTCPESSPSPSPEQFHPSASMDSFPPLTTSHHDNKNKKRLIAIIAGSIAGGILFLSLLAALLVLLISKKKKRKVAEDNTRPRDQEPKTTEREETEQTTIETREVPPRNATNKPNAFSWETESSGKLVFCGGVSQMYGMEELLRASAETLGRGMVGSTYKAVMETGFIVTVKRLKEVAGNGRNREEGEEFRRKAEELGKIRHPNIVPLRAFFQAKEEKLLVYDYFPNGSLFSLIHGSRPSGKGKPLHWTSCLKIAEDVAAGLMHLHLSGLVHANLKPSNVLLGPDFESCITDFALVPSFLPTSSSSSSSSLPSPSSSSLFYRAPETRHSRSSNPFTPSSDVFSFGILLLELLTGKVPFQDLVEEHGADIPKWVRSVREEETAESGEESETAEEKLSTLLEIAMACVSVDLTKRPSTENLLRMVREARAEAMVSSTNSSDRERERQGNSPSRWSDTVLSLPRDHGSDSFAERD